MNNFNDINQFRLLTGLNETEFCRVNKINRGTWWKWKTHVSKPSEYQLERLTKKYNTFMEKRKEKSRCKEVTDVYKKIDAMTIEEVKKSKLLPIIIKAFILGVILFAVSSFQLTT